MEDLKMLNGSIETGSRGTFSSAVCAVLLFFIVWVMLPSVVCAASSDTDLPVDPSLTTAGEACSEACPPDTLTVEAGYSNWPADKYEVKKVFTLAEIKTMPLYGKYYTFISDNNELIIDFALGIRLADLLPAAGINIEDIEELIFYAEYGNQQQRVSFSKEELFDIRRFCNYSLQQYYDPETGMIREYKRWAKALVDPMLTFEEAWMQASEVTGFSIVENRSEDNRFRLVFGQTDRLEKNMSRALPHIHTVSVIFSGSAPVPVADTVNDQEKSEAVPDTAANHEETGETMPGVNDHETPSDSDKFIEGTEKNDTYEDRPVSFEASNEVTDEEPKVVVMSAPLNSAQTSAPSLKNTISAEQQVYSGPLSESGHSAGYSMSTPTSRSLGSFISPMPIAQNPAEYSSPAPATEGSEVFGMPSPESEDSIPLEDDKGQYAESITMPAPEDVSGVSPDLQKTRRILCLAAFGLILGIIFNTLLRYLRSRYEQEKKADQSTSYNGRIQGDLL